MKSLAAGLKSAECSGGVAKRNGADLKTAVSRMTLSVNSSRLGSAVSAGLTGVGAI